jgi:hypothetical protein
MSAVRSAPRAVAFLHIHPAHPAHTAGTVGSFFVLGSLGNHHFGGE